MFLKLKMFLIEIIRDLVLDHYSYPVVDLNCQKQNVLGLTN